MSLPDQIGTSITQGSNIIDTSGAPLIQSQNQFQDLSLKI